MIKKAALFVFIVFAALLLRGRSGSVPAQGLPPTPSAVRLPRPTPPVLTRPPQRRLQPTATQTQRISLPDASPTSLSRLTPTLVWIYRPPGELEVPVLLYHHVADSDEPRRYYVSPEVFEQQISSLHDWGYTAIPLSLLVEAMLNGAELPLRPVVITFDDGYRDVYQNALPVMRRYGFVGTIYVIVDQIGVGGYMNARQIAALVEQGWELGSHTQTHANLRKPGVSPEKEVAGSKEILESMFNTPVNSFSFPYGSTNPAITLFVKASGYKSAVGLGSSITQRPKNIYYMSRNEVQGTFDLTTFAGLLR